MSIIEQRTPPLVAGDKLTREEFLERWEAMPTLKRAELIGGIVYMPSPTSLDHGHSDGDVAVWLGNYAVRTPGTKAGSHATWKMLQDAPQPDDFLRILPEYGGQSGTDGIYAAGAPELGAEVCWSSTAYDLHQKKDLYEAAGVKEYVAVLLQGQEVRWHRLVAGSYQLVRPSTDGIIRSSVFPGLWLHVEAFLAGNMLKVLEVLDQGLKSPEHAEFVTYLAARKTGKQS